MALKLKNIGEQVIVITGASSGIGLVTAKMAARRHACVVLAARNERGLARAVEEIRAEGGAGGLCGGRRGRPRQGGGDRERCHP